MHMYTVHTSKFEYLLGIYLVNKTIKTFFNNVAFLTIGIFSKF